MNRKPAPHPNHKPAFFESEAAGGDSETKEKPGVGSLGSAKRKPWEKGWTDVWRPFVPSMGGFDEGELDGEEMSNEVVRDTETGAYQAVPQVLKIRPSPRHT